MEIDIIIEPEIELIAKKCGEIIPVAVTVNTGGAVSLEIRDDLCLWLQTPETYEGVMFNIQNGNLIAII